MALTLPLTQLPPHDLEAEAAVLGSVLVDGEAWPKVCGIVRPSDFFITKNGWIFQACLDLAADGVSLNQITVCSALADRDQLEEAGGIAYVSKIIEELPTPVGCEFYAQIVRNKAIRRNAIERAMRLQAAGYRGNGQLAELLADFERESEELRAEAEPMLGDGESLQVIEGAAYAEYEPEAPHAIESIAPQCGITLFGGLGESKKSWAISDALMCVAAGTPWLSRFLIRRPGLSVLFEQDMGDPDEVKRRLHKLAEGHKIELETLPLLSVVGQGLNLNQSSDYGLIARFLRKREAVVAGFDSAPDFFGDMKLTDDMEVRHAVKVFQALSRETGAAVIATHHERKPSREGDNSPKSALFGSVYWYNKVDAFHAFKKHSADRILVVHGKSRKAGELPNFTIDCTGMQHDSYVRLSYGGEPSESVEKRAQAEGWILEYMAENGIVSRKAMLDAALAGKIASERTLVDTLGMLVGSGLIAKGHKPSDSRNQVSYWLEGDAPEWTKTEAMV
jgi:hypothetical protein